MGDRKADNRQAMPLDIRLSLKVNFGDTPEEAIQVIENRKLKFVGNVFRYRDRIVRFLLFNTLRAAAESPRVYSELAPGLSWLELFQRAGQNRKK